MAARLNREWLWQSAHRYVLGQRPLFGRSGGSPPSNYVYASTQIICCGAILDGHRGNQAAEH
jgi:hypothetical protein